MPSNSAVRNIVFMDAPLESDLSSTAGDVAKFRAPAPSERFRRVMRGDCTAERKTPGAVGAGRALQVTATTDSSTDQFPPPADAPAPMVGPAAAPPTRNVYSVPPCGTWLRLAALVIAVAP